MRFLLPCTCGKQIPLEPSQAGQALRCECGAELIAPSLRELRQLPQTEDTPEQKAATRPRWSHEQGTMFVGGAVLALFCSFIAVFFQWARSPLDVNPPTINYEAIRSDMPDMPATAMLDEWTHHLEHSLERSEPHYLKHRKFDRIFLTFVVAASVGLATGVTLMTVSMLKKKKAASEASAFPKVGSSK